MTDRLAVFNRHRPRLYGLAYRMLGMRAEAEDVVQDAWLRWQDTNVEELRSPEAWLVTVATHLALDRLRAAQRTRETYTGPWLPEPIVPDDLSDPQSRLELQEDISLAFLALLEQLTPDERAAFLLREVFDYDYADVARMLSKGEAACRQLVHRAKTSLHARRPRFAVDRQAHLRILEKFIHAAATPNEAALQALFAEDATVTSDGGGKVRTALRVIHGRDRVVRLWCGLARRHGTKMMRRIGEVNGEPALLMYLNGILHSVNSVLTDGERILGMYGVANPDKLAALSIPRTLSESTSSVTT